MHTACKLGTKKKNVPKGHRKCLADTTSLPAKLSATFMHACARKRFWGLINTVHRHGFCRYVDDQGMIQVMLNTAWDLAGEILITPGGAGLLGFNVAQRLATSNVLNKHLVNTSYESWLRKRKISAHVRHVTNAQCYTSYILYEILYSHLEYVWHFWPFS